MSEYLNKKAVLDDLHTEKNHLVYRRDKSDYQPEKTYCSWRIEQIDITIEKILSGAFDADTSEIQRLRAALEEVHEELKTLHFMIDHDDDIFHERKKKYLSIIDYVGQSVAGQALSTTTEPINAEKVERVREGDGNEMNQAMIDALNSLEVVEWSSSCGELEYVVAANTEENRKVLLDAGFTTEQIDEATDDGETDIDLTVLAIYYTDAVWWSLKDGFSLEKGDGNDA